MNQLEDQFDKQFADHDKKIFTFTKEELAKLRVIQTQFQVIQLGSSQMIQQVTDECLSRIKMTNPLAKTLPIIDNGTLVVYVPKETK